MSALRVRFGLLIAILVVASFAPSSARQAAQTGQGPTLSSIGPLAFGPDGTLFTADNQGAAIYALDLGAQANGSTKSSRHCSAPARARSR